ncbi:MAG: small multi-drug export protein [Chloroflexi bacterium]|nr:small multi-drug export protein [Chloroflexota bacterium]
MSATDILAVVAAAMTPIGELRVAIPLGIETRGMAWYEAYGWAVLGNLVPVVVLLWALDPLSKLLLAFPNPAGRLLEWRVDRLRKARAKTFQRWGALALVPFVAIPLPITGAWTGCLAAWAFGIRRRTAFPAIVLGVLLAGAIVTLLTELVREFPFIGD